ncbi:phosphomannomutase/phosphoglucomutase [Planctomycetota bacterium]|nr:phosphomannomutase/phosphoglucomutase [Planctomycetota bacterium]
MGIFGAYDVRGIVPDDLNESVIFGIGYGFAKFLCKDHDKPRIAVGMDARPSGPGLVAAFLDGLKTGGAIPEFIGPCSSPMLYFCVAGMADTDERLLEYQGGAMVTASHNPKEYNGVKFCREEAIPIGVSSGLDEIEELAKTAPKPPVNWKNTPTLTYTAAPKTDAEDRPDAPFGVSPQHFAQYAEHAIRFARRMPEGLKIAVDTANGMGALYLSTLRHLGFELIAINTLFDGNFPNHEANPSKLSNLEPLIEVVKREGCQLGLAFDGDADRAVFIDENGTPVGQDMIVALVAQELLKRHKGASILYDLRCSRIVKEVVEAAGGRAVRERVGHSFMKATMRKMGCIFGGELAGHYYFKDNWYADSAIITVLEVLNAMGLSNGPLSTLIKPLRKYSQSGEINFRVEDKAKLFEKIKAEFAGAEIDELDGVTVQFEDWWFNVRASNTEPLVRLNLEAPDAESVSAKVVKISKLLGKALD